jgi:hypothetical protein
MLAELAGRIPQQVAAVEPEGQQLEQMEQMAAQLHLLSEQMLAQAAVVQMLLETAELVELAA